MTRKISNSRTALLCTTGVAAACLALQPTAASAQGTPAPAAGQSDEAIVVTGSRIARDGFDASTPVAVIDDTDIKLSGTVNVERMLSEQPQFVASTNGGATSNTVPGGTADVNLRGFGATRNLVLVNGRRFAIAGPEQTTDLNTIPTALIERTEIVTGGSSAVYGSDAITGVVNFIIRDDFEGLEGRAQLGLDSSTKTLNKSFTVTAGGNFAEDRGNVVVSVDYATRGGITRGERGGFTGQSLNDGCITSDTATPYGGGTRLTVPAGQTCRGAGGIPGFFFAPGSGDIPFSRLSGVPLPGSAQSNPALNAAYAAAGLGTMSSFGITFDPTGMNQRAALDPQDRYDLAPENYLIIPQERWMLNTFAHYDIADGVTGYLEGHYSRNEVKMQLAPSNVGVPTLLNVNNPFLSPAMREVLNQLDLRETGTTTVVSGPASRTTTPGDGLAALTVGKRYVEAGPRQADEKRNVFRVTAGLRGDIGSNDEGFLSNLAYDAYYTYARTETTELLFNALSRSRLQASQLSAGGGAAPVCNVFGSNVSDACAGAIRISATNTTEATLQVASASITGDLFELWGGPAGFSFGGEWRKTAAQYRPDSFLSSGDVVGFNAGLPTGGSITAKEVFGEVRLPLLSDEPFFEELTLNGAFRYSDYSLDGIGGVWTWLGGAEWQPVEDIRFRAQFQHAIRAPNVGDLYAGSTRSVPVATDPCSSRQPVAQQTAAVRAVCAATGVPTAAVFTAGVQPNNFFPVDAGGNPDLGPEESDTFTAGLVLTPRFVPNLRFSADYFDIALDGAIAPLGGGLNNTLNLCYNVLQDPNSEFCQAVNRNPVTGEINDPYTVKILQANTGGLETSGIDLALQYEFEIGLGRISVGSDWTWTDEFTATPVQAMPQIQNECVGSWGLTCGEPIPEWRGITRINLQSGIWSLGLRHRYIASVTNDRFILPSRAGGTPPALDTLSYPVLPSRNYFDLNFTVDVVENFQFYGGARNIFNEKPPAVGSQSVRSNTWPATYDVLGTEMFLGLIAKF